MRDYQITAMATNRTVIAQGVFPARNRGAALMFFVGHIQSRENRHQRRVDFATITVTAKGKPYAGHVHIGRGKCPHCGHYGDDCTGAR